MDITVKQFEDLRQDIEDIWNDGAIGIENGDFLISDEDVYAWAERILLDLGVEESKIQELMEH